MLVHPARARTLSDHTARSGPVVHWLSRDQRADDNWALLFAAEKAKETGAPLVTVFCLDPAFPGATARHAHFMLTGLAETEADLRARHIPLVLLIGDPAVTLPSFLERIGAGLCVTDFDPLRVKQRWKKDVAKAFAGPLVEVDAHNVVPCFLASTKREYTAATLRPKIHKRLPEFLEPFPELPAFPAANLAAFIPVDWKTARGSLAADPSVAPLTDPVPGPAAGRARLADFAATRLPVFAERRNDPNAEATSGLSPYFHFGQLAPQRAVLRVLAARSRAPAGADAFLEEAVVRRELADNFCWYEADYDTLAALPDWARATLAHHAGDARDAVYTRSEFETAASHEALWNAAQRELTRTGRIHGYLRMYWAKKILEWSATPGEALDTALTLNDRYALDGRDPNGVVGVLWSVGGLHDRPWADRPVFGQVRYMNERGCRRKFDVDAYIDRFPGDIGSGSSTPKGGTA
jgi:deoxyribodipyrimidine photo-lyase